MTVNTTRVEMIRQRLEEALAPQSLEVIDDSHLHAGHKGAEGKGHFTIKITARAFEGLSIIQSHRRVYDALSELMSTDIHALSIKTTTPEN